MKEKTFTGFILKRLHNQLSLIDIFWSRVNELPSSIQSGLSASLWIKLSTSAFLSRPILLTIESICTTGIESFLAKVYLKIMYFSRLILLR